MISELYCPLEKKFKFSCKKNILTKILRKQVIFVAPTEGACGFKYFTIILTNHSQQGEHSGDWQSSSSQEGMVSFSCLSLKHNKPKISTNLPFRAIAQSGIFPFPHPSFFLYLSSVRRNKGNKVSGFTSGNMTLSWLPREFF